MACALCGSDEDGEGGLCARCATLRSSFTETLGTEDAPSHPAPALPAGAKVPGPSGARPGDPTSPLLHEPLPLPRPPGLTFGPGDAFGDRYTIVEEVGAGGMGQVYKAIDRQLGRAVALKLIRPDHAARAEARERFQRELLLARQVTHPNVCRVHDLGEVKGIRYISMEYIEGQTLEDLIHSVGHLSPKQTVALGKQVCSGLSAIHERGIVHRDLKPGNIMIDRAGHALLMDFGMAYRPGGEKLTAAGAVLGTLAYLSPEHARGSPTDARSDLYALGLILFEMLTGRRPPGDENLLPLAVRDASETCPPPSRLVPEVPAPLDAVVLRCLDREPAKRYASARELEGALTEVGLLLTSYSSTLVPTRTPRTPLTLPELASSTARKPWAWLAAGAALVALGSIVWPNLFPPQPRVASVALMVLDYKGPESNEFLREFLPAVIGDSLRTAAFVQVAPFASSRTFQDTDPPAKVAEALGVDHVVTGVVRVDRGQVESWLEVHRREGGKAVRVGPRSAAVGSASEAADRLAGDLARALGKTPPPTRARNPKALDLYMEGRRLLEGWDVEKNYDKAVDAFHAASESDPGFAEARAGSALAFVARFQETREPSVIEQASQEARRAVDLNASLPEAHLALGMVQVLRGQSAEAEVSLRRAQELAPADDAVCRIIGRAYFRLRRFKEAESYFERALLLRPNFWENHNAIGWFFLRRGMNSRAREYFTKVIEHRPLSDAGHINMALAFILDGQFEKAEPFLLEALKLGQSYQAHTNLGIVYYNTGRFEAAVLEFRAAIEAGGTQVESLGGLGDALRQLGRQSEALSPYQEAAVLARDQLRVDPGNGELRSILAMVLAGASSCREAREEAARVGATTAALPPATFSYTAIAYAICGDHAAAVRDAARAIDGGAIVELRSNPDLKAVREDAAIRTRLGAPGR